MAQIFEMDHLDRKSGRRAFTERIIGEFLIKLITQRIILCSIISFHVNKIPLSTKMLRKWGKTVGAAMEPEHAQLLLQNRRAIPPEFEGKKFLFLGNEEEKSGFVREVNYDTVDWWCLVKRPDPQDCGSDYVMIHIDEP